MSKYEVMVIIKALLSEEERVSAQKRIQTTLEKLEGKILSTDVWGKRHLAYEIDKQKEGYYVIYQIEMPSAGVKKFEEVMNLDKEILRFLVTKK